MKQDTTTAALKAGITSMSQLRAMQILVSGPETLTNLAATIGISTAAITGLADKFERLGLAVRVRGSMDRRSVWLRLAPPDSRRPSPRRHHRRPATRHRLKP